MLKSIIFIELRVPEEKDIKIMSSHSSSAGSVLQIACKQVYVILYHNVFLKIWL